MKKFNGFLALFLAIIFTGLGGAIGYRAYFSQNTFDSQVYVSGGFSVHFLELGNVYTGDCTYIKSGDTDILIDAGSNTSSIPTITEYLDKYVTDGILEYVIVTHAHEDHYAGFATNEKTDSLFDIYECKTIIDFAATNQKDTAVMYNNYLRERDAEIAAGATHYTARECIEQNKNVFELDGATMTILDQKFYYEEAKTENDYSVCTLFTHGDRNFLFTGDLEKDGELSLIEKNQLPEVELYKAGHHGSKTSSSAELMAVIKPDTICVCCCAGSDEYRAAPENRFPSQDFVNNVAPYTDKVYVTTLCTVWESGSGGAKEFTSMNGNITVISGMNGIEIVCSASKEKLKDSEWFKNNRICPDSWK